MKKIIFAAFAALLLAGCAKPDAPRQSSDCTLSSLKAFVYREDASPLEFDLLSGMYLPDKGNASFTFPYDDSLNAETLRKCRLEAVIPSTAVLEMTDESGRSLGVGLGGWHNLYNYTIYFKIIAANGDFRQYIITCKCRN